MRTKRWVLAAGLAALPAGASAQPSSSADTPKVLELTKAETKVEPVSLSQIGEEADRTEARLEEIRGRIEAGPSLGSVEHELPAIVGRIGELQQEIGKKELDQLPERAIEDLTFAWNRVSRRVQELQAQLGDESARFEKELQRVQVMLERWQATEQTEGITPTARQQVKSTIREVERVDKQIRRSLDQIHDAQGRVSSSGQVVTAHLADFAAAREQQRDRILSRGDPIWQVSPLEGPSPLHMADGIMRRQAEQIVAFARDEVVSLVTLVITWIVTWWVLVVLARLPRSDGPDLTLGLESSLMRPRAAALVLSVALFALLGPPMPWALRQAAWLVVLPGLVRLLTPTPYRSIAVVFAGPLLLSLVSELVPETTPLARYVHLVVSAAGLLAALWVGRWRRNEALRGLGLKGMRLAEVLLAASLVANVAGYGRLAPVVNHATMFGIYAAVLIIACVGVIRALVRMSMKTELLCRSRAIRDRGDRIADVVIRYVVVGAWLLWLVVAANGFGLAEPLWASVRLWLESPWALGAISVSPGDLVAFGLTLYATLLVARLLGFVLDEDVLPRLNLGRGMPSTVSMLIRYFVLAIGVFVAMLAAGVELGKVAILLGALGVGIGFGLQTVVNDFVSGLILMFERPVKVGDTVEVESLLGEVTRIGLRASRIRTLQGAEVIVPNHKLTTNEVTNWTLSDRRRRFEIDVGVAYGTDPQKVLEVLVEVARGHERILLLPEPAAWFRGFGDSSLNFQLLVWTDDFDNWRGIRSELTVEICRALAEAGITIPFPQRDLHLRSVEGALLDRVQGRGSGEDRGEGRGEDRGEERAGDDDA